MKQCFTCKKKKQLSEFCSDKQKKDGKSSYCDKCRRLRDNLYSQKPERKIWLMNKNQVILIASKRHLVDYLKEHPCVDCGETDIIVLDFDHIGDKKMDISKMLHNYYSWSTILAEINKCEVRCANCHRRKTHNHTSYYRRGVV